MNRTPVVALELSLLPGQLQLLGPAKQCCFTGVCSQKVEIRGLGRYLVSFMTLAQPITQQLQTSVTWHRAKENWLQHVWAHFCQQEVHFECGEALLGVMQRLLNHIEPHLSPCHLTVTSQKSKSETGYRHTPVCRLGVGCQSKHGMLLYCKRLGVHPQCIRPTQAAPNQEKQGPQL